MSWERPREVLSDPVPVNRQMRECRLCHRVGYARFVVAGGEQWECANDRACARRKAKREAES